MHAKRLVGLVVAVVSLIGLGGVALANGLPSRPSYLSSDPTTTLAGPRGDKRAHGKELMVCAKAKVDAGATKMDAVKACATELGLPGVPKDGPRGPKGDGDHGGPLGPIGKATHGELVVPKDGGGFETVAFDRGTVTSVDAGSVTLHRADGPSVTVKLVDTTKYHGKVQSAADLKPGDDIDVLSAGGVARVVRSSKR